MAFGGPRELRDLELGGNWAAPKNGHVVTVGFLRETRGLEELLLHTLIVDELRRRLPWKG